MPQITAIEPQRRKGRLNIFVDGQFIVGVGESVVMTLRLRVGQTITPERLREISSAEEIHKATEAALSLLEVRARSRHEIETRLRQKGYEGDVIAQVAEKLIRLGLLDDTQFAALWIESKTREGASRPVGKRRLANELHQKGIAPDEIQEAVSRVSAEDELALAFAAARKKVRRTPTERDQINAERQKLIGFLQRRGFGWEIVKQVASEMLPHAAESDDDF